MVFLCSITTSLFATYTFIQCWAAIPVSWLFDCSQLSNEERSHPHPRSDSFSSSSFRPKIALFLIFLAVSLELWKKVALRDVFGALSLFWFLIQIALADSYYRLIPDQWAVGIALLGFLRGFSELITSGDLHGLWRFHLPALFLCIVITLFLHVLPRMTAGTPALGLGDVKLFFALAIALTTQEYVSLMTSAALLGGAVAAIMILLHKTERGVPYGTVLAVTAFFLLLIA